MAATTSPPSTTTLSETVQQLFMRALDTTAMELTVDNNELFAIPDCYRLLILQVTQVTATRTRTPKRGPATMTATARMLKVTETKMTALEPRELMAWILSEPMPNAEIVGDADELDPGEVSIPEPEELGKKPV
ncbi:hypothetical protein EVG20_g8246 [Dentipellis fragilis]|uniref:Uncharacterized protein n=1 Tax=Dentipellis fragilis TaxID=205917 RepID=A0A4Y9Y6N3_9AGAM|nr:hypothetical protein EVG20_g8246 [Dentipellis fragilis]